MIASDVSTQLHAHKQKAHSVGRAGYVAYGVIHLLVAWLAVQVATGGSGHSADTTGAMAQVKRLPLGMGLLLVITLGMALLTIWKISQVLFGVPGATGRKDVLLRIMSGCQAVALGALAVSAAKFILGSGSSASSKQESATATLLRAEGGRILVTLAGLVVIGIGVGMAIYGLTRKFEDGLQLGRLTRKAQRTVRLLGAVGYLTKGAAYSIVGGLLVAAAVTADPQKSRGLDAALHTLVGQPYGQVLLVVVAVGIACFGVFCFARARYSKR
ncbi:MAG: DUF1206 domain-containing protein [Actinocatenispora sp.]